MLSLNCLTCGFLINVAEHTENCVCEACNNTWKVIELTEYKQKVRDVLKDAKKQYEEDQARKKADEERKKQTEAYIARRQADAELERAKNAGKPQTVIVNGPNITEIADNAVSLFVAKDFRTALNSAKGVIAKDAKNIPARFIVAFGNEVCENVSNQLDKFFSTVPSLPGTVDLEDVEKLCRLFVAGRLKLANYEAKILNIVYANANDLGPGAVCKFVDEFSPNIIYARSNGSFLSGDLFDIYMKLTAFCSIPKTCFALLGAIESNPASPLKNGDYFLTVKNKKFYDEYVTRVGEIIDNMKSEKNRPQFRKAFSDKSLLYRQKTNI